MKLLTVLSGLVFISAIGSLLPSRADAQSSAETPSPYTITGIQAKLYYAQNGTFSENVLDNRRFRLYNVIIGAGSATSPSNSTLVLVELQGRAGANVEGRAVFLNVTEQTPQRRLKLKRSVAIKGGLGPTGHYYAAFLLDGTGCIPLVLVARVTGQKPTAAVEKVLPFECAE